MPVAWALTAGLLPCSRPCQLPFPSTAQQHSPVPSQNSSVSGPLHSVPLPLAAPMALGAAPPPPAASPSQQLGPDAFAIVERAQQMVEILTEENRVLHHELQGYYDNADKLHKVGGFPGVGAGKALGAPARRIGSGPSGTSGRTERRRSSGRKQVDTGPRRQEQQEMRPERRFSERDMVPYGSRRLIH